MRATSECKSGIVTCTNKKEGTKTEETVYEATIYHDTTLEEYKSGKLEGKQTQKVWLGITANNLKAQEAKRKAGPNADPHGEFMDTPPGIYLVSLPEKGSWRDKRGYLAIHDPDELPGDKKHNETQRDGLLIHGGGPCHSQGCVTAGTRDEFKAFKGALMPDLIAGNPVWLVVPNIHARP